MILDNALLGHWAGILPQAVLLAPSRVRGDQSTAPQKGQSPTATQEHHRLAVHIGVRGGRWQVLGFAFRPPIPANRFEGIPNTTRTRVVRHRACTPLLIEAATERTRPPRRSREESERFMGKVAGTAGGYRRRAIGRIRL